MTRRSLLALSIITLVVVAAALLASRQQAPQTTRQTPLLFPELIDKVNEVGRVVVSVNGRAVTVTREGSIWIVNEAGGYPARFEKVKQTLLQAAELRILSDKTSNPELYAELGVGDPGTENATSRLLSMQNPSGEQLASLILGDRRKVSDSGTGAEGQYVRRPETKQALLVDAYLDLQADAAGWIERGLVDIESSRIKSITFQHPDGTTPRLVREQADADFALSGVPESAVPEESYILNAPASVLAKLEIDNVVPADKFNFSQSATTTVLETFDGLVITVRNEKRDNLNHAEFRFDVSGTAPEPINTEEESPDSGPDVSNEARTLNDKVNGWIFVLPEYKYSLLVKQQADMVKSEEQSDPVTTP